MSYEALDMLCGKYSSETYDSLHENVRPCLSPRALIDPSQVRTSFSRLPTVKGSQRIRLASHFERAAYNPSMPYIGPTLHIELWLIVARHPMAEECTRS